MPLAQDFMGPRSARSAIGRMHSMIAWMPSPAAVWSPRFPTCYHTSDCVRSIDGVEASVQCRSACQRPSLRKPLQAIVAWHPLADDELVWAYGDLGDATHYAGIAVGTGFNIPAGPLSIFSQRSRSSAGFGSAATQTRMLRREDPWQQVRWVFSAHNSPHNSILNDMQRA